MGDLHVVLREQQPSSIRPPADIVTAIQVRIYLHDTRLARPHGGVKTHMAK